MLSFALHNYQAKSYAKFELSRLSGKRSDILKNIDGCEFESKLEVVNYINAQFINAASECGLLSPNIDLSRMSLANALPSADRSLRFRPFTALEIFTIINTKVANKPTKDIYEISTNLLISIAFIICLSLQILFNRCLREGVYPKPLKEVKVCPQYKGKGSKTDPRCYRPIAIIPAVAKILENGLTTRITEFLNVTNALSDRQYAYRAGRSTTMLVREVVQKVLEARERKNEVAVLFCDLSKAFDVADHNILKMKLQHYGIDGPALDLLVDFLSERKQTVVSKAGSLKSMSQTAYNGIPQGSSLSNLAFTLLLNDLPLGIENCEIYMYAELAI
ncbi:jg20532 [Pararge aegeria aegeria]|uniref:Jg20532 protein n=1 Tax=Pararge aegeria aegeria TaxID=348720 RepID=A0A8S4R341_9NEOP|nr:jg20532 [Pararge aegeria aegeria]